MARLLVEQDYKSFPMQELTTAMRKRGMLPVIDEDGKVVRAECIRRLKEWDDLNNKQTERVWVTFQESSVPSAGPYVFASINDKNFQAPYGKKVCVPKYFLTDCIDRAVQKTYTQDTLSDGTFVTKEHCVPVYPYILHGPAEDDTPMPEVQDSYHATTAMQPIHKDADVDELIDDNDVTIPVNTSLDFLDDIATPVAAKRGRPRKDS